MSAEMEGGRKETRGGGEERKKEGKEGRPQYAHSAEEKTKDM